MKDRLAPHFSTHIRFLMGLSLIIPWVFIDLLPIKLAGFLALALVTTLSGKKLKWGYFLLLILTISLFHLLTPSGRVFARIGSFNLTLGALEQGLLKSLTLIGLVFISLSTVKPGLKLPGSLGKMLGITLLYYQELLTYRKHLKPSSLIPDLDKIMMDLDHGEPVNSTVKTTAQGWLYYLIVVILFISGVFLGNIQIFQELRF